MTQRYHVALALEVPVLAVQTSSHTMACVFQIITYVVVKEEIGDL